MCVWFKHASNNQANRKLENICRSRQNVARIRLWYEEDFCCASAHANFSKYSVHEDYGYQRQSELNINNDQCVYFCPRRKWRCETKSKKAPNYKRKKHNWKKRINKYKTKVQMFILSLFLSNIDDYCLDYFVLLLPDDCQRACPLQK